MSPESVPPFDDLAEARRVIDIEAKAVLSLRDRIGESFQRVIALLLSCKGKVVVSGVGKSGIVGRKIAATLSSTGTPAHYLDPVEALHGDLGTIRSDDIVIAVSNSGEADELLNAVVAAKDLGARIVALTGNPKSTLAQLSDIVIDCGVQQEACPLGLAPTASTTAALAMGDAIAMVLMRRKGFRREDYALFHPGGTLGRRLKLRVRDIMRTGDQVPIINETDSLATALEQMSVKDNLGLALITNGEGVLTGIITDGDLRRILSRAAATDRIKQGPVGEVMKRGCRTIDPDVTAAEAVRVMEAGPGAITSLAIVDAASRPIGIIHLHDILGRGRFMI